MRIAVCENTPELTPGSDEWHTLIEWVAGHRPDTLLLNELPFGPWVGAAPQRDDTQLLQSQLLHATALGQLEELGTRWVLGTRPTLEEGISVNQAFVWDRDQGMQPVHTKQFFPDEEGYYEARWFARGRTDFELAALGQVRVGFLICTEAMFTEWARFYGRSGAHVIAVPRAVGPSSLHRWRTALSMAAIVSGCYVVSSNRSGIDSRGQEFGGCGWIFDPEGDLVAETSPSEPVMSIDIDIDEVEQAQKRYPCYVADLPNSPTNP